MSAAEKKPLSPKPFSHKMAKEFRRLFYAKPVYRSFLKKYPIDIKIDIPVNLFQGDGDVGLGIISGVFDFCGRKMRAGDDPWQIESENGAWQNWLHRFDWLRDLVACKDPRRNAALKRVVTSWLEREKHWSETAWRGDILAERTCNWLVLSPEIISIEDETFRSAFKTSLSLQMSYLMGARFYDMAGFALLKALRGQFYCAVLTKLDAVKSKTILDRLILELEKQVLPDGGHVSRNPRDLTHVFALCLELNVNLQKFQIEVPIELRNVIDRMAPMVRTLRHTDGQLALFHGGNEMDIAPIDAFLQLSENQGQPIGDARHSGFQRMAAGQSVLLFDCGVPAPPALNKQAHAAPLAFEFSYGDDRLFVNCGAARCLGADWDQALSATAAHNTLLVDGQNALMSYADGGIQADGLSVSYDRMEENGHILVEAHHNAYQRAFGLLHYRSLYLNKTGDDLRGEDRLVGAGGSKFELIFHLHPEVQPSLMLENKGVLLKLPHGSGWHLRSGLGHFALKESVYAGQEGQIQRTQQVVISGALRGEGAQVKWRLSKIA